MFSVIRESISILNASPKMDKAMKEIKLIPSRRQPENLKRILTRAKFATDYTTPNEPKVSQCKDPRCQTCKEILVTIAKNIAESGIKPIVSAIVPRYDALEPKRVKVNYVLRDLCEENKISYTDHANIDPCKYRSMQI